MKKDWTYYRKRLSEDFRLEHDYERLQRELDAWAAYLERQECTIEKLRKNFAQYLAPIYKDNPSKIAELCDEILDRSGELLGYVREASEKWAGKGERIK